MRSIRRSMTVYMLVLLAATLGVVWVVIDQVTARALAAREAASADRINANYQERCHNERERIDEVLLQQAKDLGNAMHQHYGQWISAEFSKFGSHGATANSLLRSIADNRSELTRRHCLVRAYATIPEPSAGPTPGGGAGSSTASTSRASRFPKSTSGTSTTRMGVQITSRSIPRLVGSGFPSRWRAASSRSTTRSSMLGLADPVKPLDSQGLIDWTIGYTTLGPDQERVRRVLYKAPYPRRIVRRGGPRRCWPAAPAAIPPRRLGDARRRAASTSTTDRICSRASTSSVPARNRRSTRRW